jgi:hypothetical protein
MLLTPENLVELRRRFVNFYDGVVASVELQLLKLVARIEAAES